MLIRMNILYKELLKLQGSTQQNHVTVKIYLLILELEDTYVDTPTLINKLSEMN